MEVTFDQEQLLTYLKSFYALTNMRVVLFDNSSQKICAYPEEDSCFCKTVQNTLGLKDKCLESNCLSFSACKRSGRIAIYHCHASLVEASAILRHKGIILGYVMIGQCSDIKDKQKRFLRMKDLFQKEGIDISSYRKEIEAIRYKSEEQFKSAALILEALVNYLTFENVIAAGQNDFINELSDYIDKHIQTKIDVDSLCRHFGYGRTKLYELSARHLHMSLATYITLKRMEKAKDLLLDPYRKIVDVADLVGYSDLNYFSKAFKKVTGLTPSEYRSKNSI